MKCWLPLLFVLMATSAFGYAPAPLVWLPSASSLLPLPATFARNSNANLTAAGALAYGYDDANQLTSITESGEWKTEFVYDGLGRPRLRQEYDWKGSAWVQTEEHRYVYTGCW